MNFHYTYNILEFLDLSIILSVSKEITLFEANLQVNHRYFQRNGLELIIIADHPNLECALIDVLNQYPFLNYKVLINKEYNLGKTYNLGIRHASRKYILVIEAGVAFGTDVVYQLRYMLAYFPDSYAVTDGCIMIERCFMEDIHGFSERSASPAINLYARLDLLRLTRIEVPQAVINKVYLPSSHTTIDCFPKQTRENDHNWGMAVSQVIYSTEKRTSKQAQCEAYLQSFDEYWIKDAGIFQQRYRLIALMQIRNEIKYLPDVLLHLDQHCDGIILLDDGSTDGSYEAAMSEKLLMKVKKQPEQSFDDLKLRNLTLDLAAFVAAEWLFFFDADERFHELYADLYSIVNRQDVDSVGFSVIHLWDNEDCYKVNLPERSTGILYRPRMFRTYGHLQITTNRNIHFPAVPFKRNRFTAPILIKHYGNIDPEVRKMKYERYVKQDTEGRTQGYSYDYLIENQSDLKPVTDLSIDLLFK